MTSKKKSENPVKASLGSYRVEQRQIIRAGRVFHFVSYEDRGGSPAWFLMNEGKRWEVATQIAGEDPAELDKRLTAWLDENVGRNASQTDRSTTERSEEVRASRSETFLTAGLSSRGNNQ